MDDGDSTSLYCQELDDSPLFMLDIHGSSKTATAKVGGNMYEQSFYSLLKRN